MSEFSCNHLHELVENWKEKLIKEDEKGSNLLDHNMICGESTVTYGRD